MTEPTFSEIHLDYRLTANPEVRNRYTIVRLHRDSAIHTESHSKSSHRLQIAWRRGDVSDEHVRALEPQAHFENGGTYAFVDLQ